MATILTTPTGEAHCPPPTPSPPNHHINMCHSTFQLTLSFVVLGSVFGAGLAPGYGAPKHEYPQHNCSVAQVTEDAETCAPTFATVYEVVIVTVCDPGYQQYGYGHEIHCRDGAQGTCHNAPGLSDSLFPPFIPQQQSFQTKPSS